MDWHLITKDNELLLLYTFGSIAQEIVDALCTFGHRARLVETFPNMREADVYAYHWYGFLGSTTVRQDLVAKTSCEFSRPFVDPLGSFLELYHQQ